ncbi:MAG TPA: anhydro-N-acetylmuramic acid kinase [Candidatus Acidoferrales bacterium]|nr:anhydro-N-acetylmuramic acid kinase [Candidatus Acidoferrales bacterium]
MKRGNGRERALRVLGLMSGTSADGIDVALARISGAPPRLSANLEAFCEVPYPRAVRQSILRIANLAAASSAEISQLNFAVGEVFARAALAACKEFGIAPREIALIGSHGQTIYHQGRSSKFPGVGKVASTMQVGEPAIIAALTGITTIADFRPADIAAGGQGAPLVPFVDYALFRDAKRGRAVLNIGGIANVTVIPAAAKPAGVFAFDTGPGNMVVDALVRHFTRGRENFDRGARLALRGRLIPSLLDRLLRDPYFSIRPPKTAGREQFGEVFAARILQWGKAHRAAPEDLIRTATVLTPLSIAAALHSFVFRRAKIDDLIVSGGGTENPLIMAQLAAELPRVSVRTSADFRVPSAAKEAFAFAILAYETFHRRPNNLPSATGARRPAILGKVCYAPA